MWHDRDSRCSALPPAALQLPTERPLQHRRHHRLQFRRRLRLQALEHLYLGLQPVQVGNDAPRCAEPQLMLMPLKLASALVSVRAIRIASKCFTSLQRISLWADLAPDLGDQAVLPGVQEGSIVVAAHCGERLVPDAVAGHDLGCPLGWHDLLQVL